MIDWLVIWGVTQGVGFVFKPILEDLAKDAAKDCQDLRRYAIYSVLST